MLLPPLFPLFLTVRPIVLHFLGILTCIAVASLAFYLGFSSSDLDTLKPDWSVRTISVPSRGVWRFEYAGPDDVLGTTDDVYSENVVYIPTGRNFALELSSPEADTGFYIPNLRSNTGVLERVTKGSKAKVVFPAIELDAAVRYQFFCTEYCGPNHYKMHGPIVVLPPALLQSRMSALPTVRR